MRVRNIVLMRPVNSMIEFKQIIGRGTRLFDGKDYFTIYDFVRAYEHFNDPEWDGEPVEPVPPRPMGGDEEPTPPTGGEDGGDGPEGGEEEPAARQKIKIKLADGKERTIQHMMATTFWSVDGRPMSAAEFITRLFGDLCELFRDEDELRALWGQPDTRKALLESLSEKGYGDEQLSEIRRMIDAEQSDLFDVLAYIAFALSPITREERVTAHQEQIFSHYDTSLNSLKN
jgi:type I restriction enzyme, R subunit